MKRSLALLVPAVVFLVACVSPTKTTFNDGVRFYRAGDYASARDAFEAELRRDPTVPATWNNLGVTNARRGDLAGAVMDLTRAVQLAPTDAEILFNRANVHVAAGNPAEAIGDYTTAVTLRPGYSEAYFNRGSVRASTGDYAGAVADWQWAIDIEPDPWTRAAMRRGSALDYVAAMPRTSPMPVAATPAPSGTASTPASGGVVVSVPSSGDAAAAPSPADAPALAGAPSPVPTPGPLTAQFLDARTLAARAMSREVDGDRLGALGDLRAAVALERDAARRARIERLLRVLEASR